MGHSQPRGILTTASSECLLSEGMGAELLHITLGYVTEMCNSCDVPIGNTGHSLTTQEDRDKMRMPTLTLSVNANLIQDLNGILK